MSKYKVKYEFEFEYEAENEEQAVDKFFEAVHDELMDGTLGRNVEVTQL